MRDVSPEIRKIVLERDGFQCRYCGSKVPPFHLDHVYPYSKGGETTANNLVTACLKCNLQKHSKVGIWPKPIGYFEKRKESSRLTNLDNIISEGLVFLSPIPPAYISFVSVQKYLSFPMWMAAVMAFFLWLFGWQATRNFGTSLAQLFYSKRNKQ